MRFSINAINRLSGLILLCLLSLLTLTQVFSQQNLSFGYANSSLERDFNHEEILFNGIEKSLEKSQEVIALKVSANEKDWSKFEKFENLKYLYLDETFTADSYYISKIGLAQVFSYISSLKQLEFISLYDPRLLPYMKNMNKLRGLKFNQFDAKIYQSEAGNFPELQVLIINDPKIHSIVFSFTGFEKLEQLEIYSTALTELPKTIGNLSNLRVLNILCGKTIAVPDSYSSLKKLTYLRIVGSSVLTKFPNCIMGMDNLSILDIDVRNVKEIPDEISNLKNLKILNLNECQKIKTFPVTINQLNSLEEIYLSDADNLSDVSGLTGLKNPYMLLLNRCRYTQIAKDLRDCSSLKGIVVPNNLQAAEIEKLKTLLGENRVFFKAF